jgi:hypothetical protein
MLNGNLGKCNSESMHSFPACETQWASVGTVLTSVPIRPSRMRKNLLSTRVSGSMVTFANVSQDRIMNASAVRSPVTDASSTIVAYTRLEKSPAMISTLKALPRDG